VQPLSITQWIPGPFAALGTDGFGLSESRSDLRDHFEVSAEHIAYTTLVTLADAGNYPTAELVKAVDILGINTQKLDPATAGPAQITAAKK